jgi:hypothetical protein
MDGRNAHHPDPSARGNADPDCMLNLSGDPWTVRRISGYKDKESKFFARQETQ